LQITGTSGVAIATNADLAPRAAANDSGRRPTLSLVVQPVHRLGDALGTAYRVGDQPFDLAIARLCLRLRRKGTSGPAIIDHPMSTMPYRPYPVVPMTGWP